MFLSMFTRLLLLLPQISLTDAEILFQIAEKQSPAAMAPENFTSKLRGTYLERKLAQMKANSSDIPTLKTRNTIHRKCTFVDDKRRKQLIQLVHSDSEQQWLARIPRRSMPQEMFGGDCGITSSIGMRLSNGSPICTSPKVQCSKSKKVTTIDDEGRVISGEFIDDVLIIDYY
uniref:Uncharacterized protein n=1 Tax=Meloidogyne hapla TaxID=6305 RepID=A0A1I8BG68_MELHA